MLRLKFLVTWQRGDISKLPKNHYFALIFSIKIDFKVTAASYFSMDWDRVKCFSALVTCYLMIDLGSFLASHKSKIFLAMRGTVAPLQTPQTEWGTSPFWHTLMYLLVGGPRRKSGYFFYQHFSNENMCLGPKQYFVHYLRPKEGEGVSKVWCFAYIWGKGLIFWENKSGSCWNKSGSYNYLLINH
jgi:hypothetical protein